MTSIDEYEHRFNEIDSELDALRSSILDDDDNDNDNDNDDDDDDVQIATTTNNKEKKKMAASASASGAAAQHDKGVLLAEQSAVEMEKIVQTLREQQQQQQQQQQQKDDEAEGNTTAAAAAGSYTSSSAADAGTTKSGGNQQHHRQQASSSSSSSPTTSSPNKSSSPSSWRSLLSWFIFIIPLIVSIFLAWKLHSTETVLTTEGDGGAGSSSIAVPESSSSKPKSGGILNKLTTRSKKKKRERCQTTIDGHKYCESEEESTVPGTNQRIATFQKCWYINDGDESYCESFEQQQQQQQEKLLDGDNGGGDDNNVVNNMPLIMTLWEEFDRADTNKDGVVTKTEFDKFKNDYISNHPDGSTIETNFAKFDEFDINLDGQITEKEHEQYYNKNLEKKNMASLETTTRRKQQQQQQQQHREKQNNNNNDNINIKLMMAKQVLADEFFEFFTADTNKDRQVDRTEFDTFKRNYLKIHREMKDDDFAKFDEFDINNNGYVTLKEYERYYKNQQQQQQQQRRIKKKSNNNSNKQYLFTREQLMDEFVMADTNKNGQVDRKEFERYKRNYLQLHPEMSSENFAIFDDFDPDSNGIIEVKEHEAYYKIRGLLQ